jgi:penicillin-binding protein 2
MSNVEDRRGIITRLSVLQYVITGLFSILAISFWVLQVAQHAKFEEMAENNHQRTLALRAPRGIVLDRDGRILIENRPSFSISIMRFSDTKNRAFARLSTGIAASRRTGR